MAAQESGSVGNQDNHLELLLFHLYGAQRFAINVLKVKEVIPCPSLTKLPDSHPSVCGIATLRGEPISVVDLSRAIGRGRTHEEGSTQGSVIVTEINRTKQGFLVERVDRIVVRDWKDVLPPPKGLGARSYASGVTQVDKELIQILDVERIMGEVSHEAVNIPDELANEVPEAAHQQRILVVDDSSMARSQTAKTLEQLNIPYVTAIDGKEALELLKKFNASGADAAGRINFVLSDIEMPEMDGYNLTRAIRQDSQLSDIYVLLHTSLNGAINTERAKQCGANAFLTKFVPNDLASEVIKGMQHCVANAA
ncbi:MAG: chemotaxis protein [Gammaproteobacteria bacterium]